MPDFATDIETFAKNAKISLLKARNGICLKLFGAVVMSTPVLTGALRHNWQCSLKAPVTDALPEGQVDKEGTATIAKITAVVTKSTLDDTLVILTNNLDYSYRIEYEGWSHTKAPKGMLRINVARIVQLVEKQAEKGPL